MLPAKELSHDMPGSAFHDGNGLPDRRRTTLDRLEISLRVRARASTVCYTAVSFRAFPTKQYGNYRAMNHRARVVF